MEHDRYAGKPSIEIYGKLTVAKALMLEALRADPTLSELETAISMCSDAWRKTERKVFPWPE